MAEKTKGLTVKLGFDNSEFKKKMSESNKEIKATDRQINALQKSLELKWDAGKFAQAQKLAQDAISKTEAKAKELKDEMAKLEAKGVDTSSASYQKLQTELIKTGDQAEKLRNKLDEINQLKVDRLANSFKNAGDQIAKAGQALTPFSAAAAGVLAGLGAIGLNTINTADTLKTMADRVNLSAEALQRWQYIAMQTDVSNEELQAGLVKTQGAFGSLAKGDIDVASTALKGLGFTAEQASQGMAENFDALVQRLATIEDPILQAAYANEIFGERMGAKLIPMLKSGGEGLAALSAEFEKFDTLTNEQIDSLAEFDNVMNNIKFSFKTIKDQLGSALLPVMETMAAVIDDKIVPAVSKLANWFAELSDTQKNVLVGTLAFVAALAPALLIVGKLTAGIGGLIKGIQGIGVALKFLMANPIIAIIAAIAALMIYLYKTNEQFRESINSLVSAIGGALGPILGKLGAILGGILEALMPIINVIGNLLAPIIEALVGVISPLLSALSGILMPILNVIVPIINVIVKAIVGLVTIIGKVLTPVIKVLGGVLTAVFALIPKVIDGYLKVVEFVANKVIDFVNTLIRGVNNLGKFIGVSLSELDNVSITADVNGPEATKPSKTTPAKNESAANVDKAMASSEYNSSIVNNTTNTTSNDYSNKDIQINVTVQNYSESLDVDDIARQVNLKLAQGL